MPENTPNQSDAMQLVVMYTQSFKKITVDATNTVSGHLVLTFCWIKSVKVERVTQLLYKALSL